MRCSPRHFPCAPQRSVGVSHPSPQFCPLLVRAHPPPRTVWLAPLHGLSARLHHPHSCRLAPELPAACHTFGAFFRSKFLFQSLLPDRVGLPVLAAAFGLVTFGLGSHAVRVR